VNNAGIYPSTSFLEMTDSEWERVLKVNLDGAFFCSREAARVMTRQPPVKGACILFVVSVSGFRARPGLSHYATSKHGVVGLIKGMALELAPHKIRVLGVAPTLVATPGIDLARGTNTGQNAETYKEFLKQTASLIPLGRVSNADDIARVVYFCATDLALFMTGSVLMVDGGLTA